MSESRRDIFKLSVISAVGLLSANVAATAADFKVNRVVFRARNVTDNAAADILVDASYDPPMAYIMKSADRVRLSTVNVDYLSKADGTFYIEGLVPTPGSPPRLVCNRGQVMQTGQDISGNAWSEIGSRQKAQKHNKKRARPRAK